MSRGYTIWAPSTPGGVMIEQRRCDTLREARRVAAEISVGRSDLTYQDVRIESRASDQLVEYAGPSR